MFNIRKLFLLLIYFRTTNIIISQPQSGAVAKREWSHGLCGCFDDCGEFIFAYFCSLCYECRLFSLANEGFCSCLFGGLVPLRTKIRTERGINVRLGFIIQTSISNKTYKQILTFRVPFVRTFGLSSVALFAQW